MKKSNMQKFCLVGAIASAVLLTGCLSTGSMVSSKLENSVSEKDKQECSAKAAGGLGGLFSETFDGKVYKDCLKEKATKK